MSLSRPQFPCPCCGKRHDPRVWKYQPDWVSKPGLLCSAGGRNQGSWSREMSPSLCRLPERTESKEVGQTDFRWNRGLLLPRIPGAQRVEVLGGQGQGFAAGDRDPLFDHPRRRLGAAQGPLRSCAPLRSSLSQGPGPPPSTHLYPSPLWGSALASVQPCP